jgi:hypothetical protein
MGSFEITIGTPGYLLRIVTDIDEGLACGNLGDPLDLIYMPWCDVEVECGSFRGYEKVYIKWSEFYEFFKAWDAVDTNQSGKATLRAEYTPVFDLEINYDTNIVAGTLSAYPDEEASLRFELHNDPFDLRDALVHFKRFALVAKGRTP